VHAQDFSLGFEPCGNPTSSRDVKLHTLVNQRNDLRTRLEQGDSAESALAAEDSDAAESSLVGCKQLTVLLRLPFEI